MATSIHKRFIVHPYKFNLWIGIVSMVMIFAAFTSAYVVKKGDTRSWENIHLPSIFTTATIVIVISSLFMHAAYLAFKKGKLNLYRGFIVTAFILGAAFLTLQIQGWNTLVAQGVGLTSNVAGSFIYVISGAHFVHVAGSVIALMVFAIRSFTKLNTNESELMKTNTINIEVMTTYWHFVDFLWVYLYFFFLLNR
ncbi:MAG: cytochrome c oxidase subunit 3 [Bacteroidetes bacterium]|nr:cytochrome c oxidase subunit 3 [Bacteroidota bacterium]